MRELIAKRGRAGLITTAWDGDVRPGTREDRTCDRCRVYVPPTPDDKPARFFSAMVPTPEGTGGVIIGLCKRCNASEHIPTVSEGEAVVHLVAFALTVGARWAR